MELWIPITIAAAFFQNLRSMMQKYLQGSLSTTGATFARFGFGFPFALIYLLVLVKIFGLPLPQPNGWFLLYVATGGLSQILGTFCLVHLFKYRNFAVGTAFSKTEPVQAAIFSLIILGEFVSLAGAGALLIGIVGVLAISTARADRAPGAMWQALSGPVARIGLFSGALFAISAVCYRAASLSLGDGDFVIRAAYALAWATVFQTVVMLVYMRLREPGQIRATLAAWPSALSTGIFGILGSICWFTAMTIQNVAYVRALGQIELIFTLAASRFIFHERSNRRELTGVVLIAACILILLLGS